MFLIRASIILYWACLVLLTPSKKKKGIKPVWLKQTSESAEREAASEIAPKGAPTAVSLANILSNRLPLPSLAVAMITVELEAIFYKTAE